MSKVVKTVFAPHLNRTVKLGRNRPVAQCPRMHLERYLRTSFVAPASVDYTKPALAALTEIYMNDSLGDCVIAGGYHIIGTATGNATGHPFIATDAQITADYGAIGGYVPGDPATDQGCDEQTALNYWSNHPFADGSKLLGWMAVDPTNEQQIMAAMYLFENLMFGIGLPDVWINPFPSANGFVWDVADPDQNNGHCVVGVGYNSQGVQIDSWGLFGTITWKAVAALCTQNAGGGLYVALTADQLAKGQAKAPNGLSWSDLVADFNAMGGKLINAAPVQTTPPAPVAPPAVTLAQAQAWASQGLAENWGK